MSILFSFVHPLSVAMVFVIGTLIGSFLNVCIGRLPVGKSIVWPGSACTSCGVPLLWWQNLPLISYLLLRGRCYFCYSRFSARYLLLEALTGVLLATLFVHSGGPTYEFLYYSVFTSLLIIVFFVDLDAWIILDEVNYFGIFFGLLAAAWVVPRYQNGLELLTDFGWNVRAVSPAYGNLLWSAVGAAVGYVMFVGIALLGSILARQEAMGRGDVKFAAMIGAFLGPDKGFVALLLAFPLGAAIALPLILVRGKGGKTPIPFGTFMAVTAYSVVIFGGHVTDYWTAVFNPWRF